MRIRAAILEETGDALHVEDLDLAGPRPGEVLVRLHPFPCEHESGEPQTIECQATRWIAPIELRDYKFPPANDDLIEQIIRKLTT